MRVWINRGRVVWNPDGDPSIMWECMLYDNYYNAWPFYDGLWMVLE